MSAPAIFFSDYFRVSPQAIDSYGAFDINLLADVPLFVDPFLLFNSREKQYQELHEEIIRYLRFLRSISTEPLDPATVRDLFMFQEVKQNWFGYAELGNDGRGLGADFAVALREALGRVITNFGAESGTRSSHLEKVSLLRPRIGLDKISDFTTNLIKHYIVDYTEQFARTHIDESLCRTVRVKRVRFNYETETWVDENHYLPYFAGDFVLLTPSNLLVHNATWISHGDMVRRYPEIVEAVGDTVQRAKISRYFEQRLVKDATKKQENDARSATLRTFPELLDIYIAMREEDGDGASAVSAAELEQLRAVFVGFLSDFISRFWSQPAMTDRPRRNSFDETLFRAGVFKTWVEHQDGYLSLNKANGKASEKDVQRLIFLTLLASRFDVNREVNNGRGPVDFKISRGKKDAALLEVKMASNSQLRRNLENQLTVYEKANGTDKSVTVIICYSLAEIDKVNRILQDLGRSNDPTCIVVDARSDNKPSGSRA